MGVKGPSRAERPSVNTLCLRMLQGFCSRESWREPGRPRLTGLRLTSIEGLERLVVHKGAPDWWLCTWVRGLGSGDR